MQKSASDLAAAGRHEGWWRALRAAAVWLLGAAVLPTSILALADGWTYDLLTTRLRPVLPAEPRIVVVAIDEPSFAELQAQWPWPRSRHGQLVEALDRAGAAVVAFDILFVEPSDPAADAAFADAIAAAGPVLLASDEAVQRTAQVEQRIGIEPLPDLVDAGAASGFVGVDPDGDGVLRAIPDRPDLFARRALELWAAKLGRPLPAPASGPLLRFLPEGQGYHVVSYYQALDPATFLPPDLFRDAIVVVGLVVKTTPEPNQLPADTFLTPVWRGDDRLLSGVEVQATAMLNLAAGLGLAPAPVWLRLAILAAGVAAAALFLRRWTPPRAAAAVVAAIAVAAALSLWGIESGGLWFPPALLVLGVAGTTLAEGAATLIGERRGRRQIKDAFRRYLSPELVEILAREPGRLKLGGERREMTFLFCDIRGFTNLSESLQGEPERLTRIINRFLTAMTAAIRRHGGTIDKFMGDCVMAFWNAPLDQPDHPRRALRCALAMQEALGTLNAELAAEGIQALRVGIGINSGPCVVGNMGSEERFAYSVMGDAVNLASRLEGQGQRYGVVVCVGESTIDAVGETDLALLELDRIAVKGKAEPVRVYTLLGDAGLRRDPAFAAASTAQAELLAAWRRGDWAAARAAHDRVAANPLVPRRLVEVYATRLAEHEGTAPPPGWDGVLRLDSK
ncbi:MAG: adenylate/guanylate cyclase domain-containing protein [Geminicoccaceae bacterium]